MRTKYYRQDNRIVRCSDLKSFKNKEEFLEDEVKALERQIKEVKEEIESYKYDLETLVSVVSECLNKMSSEECYDTLQQVVNHYDELKEQG